MENFLKFALKLKKMQYNVVFLSAAPLFCENKPRLIHIIHSQPVNNCG